MSKERCKHYSPGIYAYRCYRDEGHPGKHRAVPMTSRGHGRGHVSWETWEEPEERLKMMKEMEKKKEA